MNEEADGNCTLNVRGVTNEADGNCTLKFGGITNEADGKCTLIFGECNERSRWATFIIGNAKTC